MEKVSLALFGATGIVGQEILAMLSEDSQACGQVQLSASDDSIGEFYDFLGAEIEVLGIDKIDFSTPTLSVLCAPKDVSEAILADVLNKSVAVIDCSGLDRQANNLILLPSSLSSISGKQGYYLRTAPGYMLSNFLKAIGFIGENKIGEVHNLTATCLESVSGAGRLGLDELWSQIRAVFNQSGSEPEFFPEQIAFNLLSHVDLIKEDGSTAFEHRVAAELEESGFEAALSITALRAPIMYGSGVSFSLETSAKLELDQIFKAIKSNQIFNFDPSEELPPSTLVALGDDKIRLGRLRLSPGSESGRQILSGWLVADNIKACVARPVVDAYRSLLPMS
jgi:aspartate-semialdehyde dehydrogenase